MRLRYWCIKIFAVFLQHTNKLKELMETLTLSLVILAIISIAYGTFCLIRFFLNLRYKNRAKINPNLVKRSFGMVYNKKTGKIEADNKIITPY